MDFLPTARIGQAGVEYMPSEEGTKLAVRIAGGSGPRTPVVMLHGLQSHSGWFVQSQTFLAGLGFPVYAMDRRGSGLSEGGRGDCTGFRQMDADVLAVVTHVRAQHDVKAVHVFGHCFGTIPAPCFEVRRACQYIQSHRHLLTMPVFMASAGSDPICDTDANERFFWSLPSRHKPLVRHERARHVIEFSEQRDDFFRDLDDRRGCLRVRTRSGSGTKQS